MLHTSQTQLLFTSLTRRERRDIFVLNLVESLLAEKRWAGTLSKIGIVQRSNIHQRCARRTKLFFPEVAYRPAVNILSALGFFFPTWKSSPAIRNAYPREKRASRRNHQMDPHAVAAAHATESGDVDALRRELDMYPYIIGYPLMNGETLLHVACEFVHLPCVQLLVERGASLGATDYFSRTPFHDACSGGSFEIVHFMLNAVGTINSLNWLLNAADNEGNTPLHIAGRNSQDKEQDPSIVNRLIHLGASSTKFNADEKVPFELAGHGTEVRRVLRAAFRRSA